MNVVILTNILSPYRRFFFDLFKQYSDKKGIGFNVILMSDNESNRTWRYEDLKTNYTSLLECRTIKVKDDIFFHLNRGLEEELSRLKPDILILGGSYTFPSIWKAIKLRKKLGYKTVFWSESHLDENKGYSDLKIKIREYIRNKFYKSIYNYWYAGELSKMFILRYSMQESKLFFIPNLVNPEIFKKAELLRSNNRNKLREKYNINDKKFIFFCPARLDKVKGILEFLNIYKNCELAEEAIILIAGEGSLRSTIEKFILEHSNIDVRLLGNKSEEEIVELYAIADCFLLPSLSDPNPLSCIEALWSGLPLFVSKHVGNNPEVIKQGLNGYVFSYSDEKNAILQINKIIKSSSEWRENASNISKSIANDIYNPIKAIERLIEEMINGVK